MWLASIVIVWVVRSISPVVGVDISLKDICGNKLVGTCPKKISLKVIGGESSCAEKVPWNVLIELTSGKSQQTSVSGISPYCGGVLITSQHVLSAAHCFWTNENPFGSCPTEFLELTHDDCARIGCPASCSRLGPGDIRLYLGVTKRTEVSQSDGRDVDKIIIHPGWDRKQKLNDILQGHDIALLRMKREVSMYDRKTIPICLPDPRKDKYLVSAGRTADVTGFGVIVSPRTGAKQHPVTVQTARVTISEGDTCRGWWDIRGGQICAAGTQVIQTGDTSLAIVADSCNGDSGGGLTASNFDGREVLIGIISFGEPECGRKGGKPGVYTNVLDHVDWIEEQISPRASNKPSSSSSSGNVIPSSGIQCIASNGKQCKFPFKFRNTVFASCTTMFDNDGLAWCSTKTDKAGVHVPNEGEFGYCPDSCLSDILSTPSTVIDTDLPAWSTWASCSATCGGGSQSRRNRQCKRNKIGCPSEQTRRCNKQPCPSTTQSSSSSSPSWSSWSSCSQSCGGGSQRRQRVGTKISQTQGCNIQRCQTSPVISQPQNNKPTNGLSTTWLVGGTGAGTSVESVVTGRPGRVLCGREISSYPTSYTSAMGGYMRGKVYVCGGNSGYDSGGTYRVHNQCYSTTPSNPATWSSVQSIPVNTTNAAYTVHDNKLYVFGGYQKPACGYRPLTQIFNSRSQSWVVDSKNDPPHQIGAYGCAVTAGDLIFVTGGWYPTDAYPYLASCKEELPDEELTAVNKDYSNYQDRVQVYNTLQGTWAQGPRLGTRRRNHGCTLVDVGGRKGIMVAGGYNSRDSYLSSVEFLDLGTSLSRIQLANTQWRNLPQMKSPRADKLVLINDRDYVHVVGGQRGDNSLVESFDKTQSRWVTQNYKTKRKRSYTTFISNIKTKKAQC